MTESKYLAYFSAGIGWIVQVFFKLFSRGWFCELTFSKAINARQVQQAGLQGVCFISSFQCESPRHIVSTREIQLGQGSWDAWVPSRKT